MAYETNLEKLRKKAAYEALSPGEKVFYHGFKGIKAAKELRHKIAERLPERFGREEPTIEEEITILKQKQKELAMEEALEKERNQILDNLEKKAAERRIKAEAQRG